MASKKQRRRKRRRAEKKRKENMAQDVAAHRPWFSYTVAARIAALGGPVTVMLIKEFDDEELIPFIMRIMDAKTIDEFDVLDIHKELPDGRVEILSELAEWPTGVGVKRMKGEYVRGLEDRTLFLKTGQPAGKKALEVKKESVAAVPTVKFKSTRKKWYSTGQLKAKV